MMTAASRIDAVDAVAPLDRVQVQLEDAPLGERALEAHGEDQLLELPPRRARRAQPQVLRQLLRDRAAAAHDLVRAEVLLRREPDLVPVEPVVGEELVVLRNEDGPAQRGRNMLERHPVPRFLVVAAQIVRLALALAHHRGAAGRALREPAHVDRPHLHERDGREHRDQREQQAGYPPEQPADQAPAAGDTTTIVMSSFCAADPRKRITSS
jgi:hypothetical protein